MEILIFFIVVGIIVGVAVYKNISNKKREQQREQEEQLKQKKQEELKIKWDEKKKEFEKNGLPVLENEILKLTKNELCHFAGDSNFCKLKKQTVGYQGGNRGVSLRIMKGVSFRVGNYQGHSIKEEIVEKTQGKIYLTNKKLVFSAITNSRVIKYSEIVNLNIVDNMIQIQTEERAYLFEVEDYFNFMVILECIINKTENND